MVDAFANKPADDAGVPTELSAHYARFVAHLGGLHASRRTVLLGLAGLSAGLPLVGALSRAAQQFTCRADERSLHIDIGGIPAWHLECDWFDGTPVLTVRRTDRALMVRLSHARFPGSDIPADLRLHALRGEDGWVARLTMPGLGFSSRFAFDRWLLGYERASGSAALQHIAFRRPHRHIPPGVNLRNGEIDSLPTKR